MSFSKFLKVGLPAMIVGATSIAGSVLSSKFGSSEISKEVLTSSTIKNQATYESFGKEVKKLQEEALLKEPSENLREESTPKEQEETGEKYEEALSILKDKMKSISEGLRS